ncbi:Flagellin N-methylase [Polystyrenella longa]|uniref:Flagellin N-methylase n=1 Tax=Polystyrenella longa TaxID=2528007 RepID=A0A518CN61_9PLAN|nr:YkgJ family cysteine cluster protein [Polystyrenella longa]QDU80658.1 Flagellin N-methylase [Polystyrenella longa]
MNNSENEPEKSDSDADKPKPWYADGLKFKCTGCGNCCTGGPGAVWISDEEVKAMADHLELTTGEFRLMHTRLIGNRLSLREYANGDCVFFDGESRGCTIYPVRPIQCQTWPFWSSNISSEDMWRHVKRDCPGAGKGDFFTLEEIEERAQRFIL